MYDPPRGQTGDESKVYGVIPAEGGFQKPYQLGARSLRSVLDEGDDGQNKWLDQRRKRLAEMPHAFHTREGGVFQVEFRTLVWIRADEIKRRKGHNYLTLVDNLLTKKAILARPNKDGSV